MGAPTCPSSSLLKPHPASAPALLAVGNPFGLERNGNRLPPWGGARASPSRFVSDTAKTVVAQLKDKGAVTRGWIARCNQ
jgi:hypothetical protein